MRDFFTTYRNVGEIAAFYWQLYGGWGALRSSPYLHLALLMTGGTYPFWWPHPAPAGQSPPAAQPPPAAPPPDQWFQLSLDILPSMLGFTLGGYAILLAVGDEGFRETISGEGTEGEPSPFINVNATFIHFIIIQALALMYAIVCKAWEADSGVIAAIGCCLLYYSILSGLAAGLSVFRLAKWFDFYTTSKRENAASPPNTPGPPPKSS